MSAHPLKVVAAAACLWAAAGCASMLGTPESARARGYASEELPEQRPPDPRIGRTPEDSPPGVSRPGQDEASGVRLSSFQSTAPSLTPASAPAAVEPGEDDDSGLELSDFYPSKIVATVKELAGYGPNEAVAQALYEEGEYLYRQGDYEQAADRFKAAAKRAPESTLQEDCLFMWGESLFFSDQYPKANEAYAELLKKYEYTRHLDKVVARQFAIGRYWEQVNAADPGWLVGFQWSDPTRPKFDTWGNAIKAYRSVRMNDPTGDLADDSIMAAANAYFLKGRYEEAAHHYDLIRKEYPKSEHQLNAHMLGMRSKLNLYQGSTYVGSPLEEAGEIADQMLRQFPDELGSERDRVVETQNRILEERAQRALARAQYYEKKKRYGSSRLYYQFILREFPTTAAARKASARLTEINDLPDKPPNRFQWLTDRLPSDNR